MLPPLLSLVIHKNDYFCVAHWDEQTTRGWTDPTFGIPIISCKYKHRRGSALRNEYCVAVVAVNPTVHIKP